MAIENMEREEEAPKNNEEMLAEMLLSYEHPDAQAQFTQEWADYTDDEKREIYNQFTGKGEEKKEVAA